MRSTYIGSEIFIGIIPFFDSFFPFLLKKRPKTDYGFRRNYFYIRVYNQKDFRIIKIRKKNELEKIKNFSYIYYLYLSIYYLFYLIIIYLVFYYLFYLFGFFVFSYYFIYLFIIFFYLVFLFLSFLPVFIFLVFSFFIIYLLSGFFHPPIVPPPKMGD